MADSVASLGARLREARLSSGLSLREVARQLGVSPSFVSQIENGKSQPSVATLYSVARLLNISIDDLFAQRTSASSVSTAEPLPVTADGTTAVSRSAFSSPVGAFQPSSKASKVSVTRPDNRPRLEMDTGVIWERLVDNSGSDLDFIRIVYPANSSSTSDNRMLQHAGMEFGYLLQGELEVTVGFDTFTLRAGEALGFDPAQPHLLQNKTEEPALGIWCVRHPHE